eukprot:TRINITY_DN13876_c0_g5_i1.p1 TRINITY_DN13876_c0_g5~~TRINITY_DN13876_c0_g5_i1.p1  ORF type:complete len:125 (-),score=15.15 TRINITY_DN13876_c0_g5_i1:1149-1523(-)
MDVGHKKGVSTKKRVTPNYRAKHCSSAFLLECCFLRSNRGRSDGAFLPFCRLFEYFQNSSYMVQPFPKHGFSMLVRKSGEDSVPGTSAKCALRALSISTSRFPTILILELSIFVENYLPCPSAE